MATVLKVVAAPPKDERRAQQHKMLRFDLGWRAGVLWASTTTLMLAWLVPMSLTSTMVQEGGAGALIVLAALTMCTLVGWLDLVVNDCMSDQWHLTLTKRNHHRGYAIIAGLYFVHAYASIGATIGIEDLLPLGYIGSGLLSAWYALATSFRGWHV